LRKILDRSQIKRVIFKKYTSLHSNITLELNNYGEKVSIRGENKKVPLLPGIWFSG
jgi:hypothetical protein